MDLLIMLLVVIVISIICIPYISKGENSDYGISQSVLKTSSFKAEDLPYCDISLCTRVKCFTYYQEVLGVWRS